MPKPFDYTYKKYSFKLHHLEDSLIDEERAKFEAKMIVIDYEGINSPYPPRKEWVFKNLQAMIDFRGLRRN